MASITDYEMVPEDIALLEHRYLNVPLKALRPSSRRKIALYLDVENVIIDDDIGMLNDWRGLAELAEFTNLEMLKFERTKRPTQELLNTWELNANSPTLGQFWSFMQRLKREDVLLECKAQIENDALNYIEREERLTNDYYPLQENTISSSTPYSSQDHYVNETKFLTKDDVDNPDNPVLYDAFICYNENSSRNDCAFVKQCIIELENKRDLKLCIPNRDPLPGGARYVCDAELIKSRCRRMIIIISHDFFTSPACDFQVKFAHSLAPGARRKRLIPVLLEEKLPIPDLLRHVTICDFTKQDLIEWFWERLASSLKAPLDDESEPFNSAPMQVQENKNSKSAPFTILRSKSKKRLSTDSSSSSSSTSTYSMTSIDSNSNDITENEVAQPSPDNQKTSENPKVPTFQNSVHGSTETPKDERISYVSFPDVVGPRPESSKAKKLVERIRIRLGKTADRLV